jgi:transposase
MLPGMATVELSAKERRRLEDTFRTTTDRRLRDRVQAVLMASGDRTQAQIAADLLVSERSVRRWLQAWRAEGLAGLEIQWAPGATPLIEETLAPEILEWVRQGPTACGLNRANWTSAELAEHLWRTHGVRVAERTMRQFLQRHEVKPYRPTYRFLKGDPVKQQTAREELAALGEKSASRRGGAAQPG